MMLTFCISDANAYTIFRITAHIIYIFPKIDVSELIKQPTLLLLFVDILNDDTRGDIGPSYSAIVYRCRFRRQSPLKIGFRASVIVLYYHSHCLTTNYQELTGGFFSNDGDFICLVNKICTPSTIKSCART